MSIADSLLVSVLGLFVVFLVLILLSFLIHIQSIILGYITAYQQRNAEASHTIIPVEDQPEEADQGWTAGELKLIGVDEKTAAMIMATISDETQIPLSELQFKKIKAIDQIN